MDIGNIVSVVESEPVEFLEYPQIKELLPPLEYITVAISETPVAEPVPA